MSQTQNRNGGEAMRQRLFSKAKFRAIMERRGWTVPTLHRLYSALIFPNTITPATFYNWVNGTSIPHANDLPVLEVVLGLKNATKELYEEEEGAAA